MSIPNDPNSTKFIQPPPFFKTWQQAQGIPVHEGVHIDNLKQVPLKHWDWFGAPAAFVNLTEPNIVNCIVLEIPPGATLNPVKHLFETWVFVIDGNGETIVEQSGYPTQAVTWQTRSLFGPPVNTTYQHRNKDMTRPARLLMLYNAPLVMNLFHDEKFVFENNFVFESRYTGSPKFFDSVVQYLGGRIAKVNYISDVLQFQLLDWEIRGKGAKSFHLSMSDHTIAAHVSEFPSGSYKKGHKHGPSAHVVILSGTGFSLLWQENKEPLRIDWQANAMFTPPANWYHQHFNTGPESARYLALRMGGSPEHELRVGETPDDAPDITFAADQIEYEDEQEWIYDTYEQECRAHGTKIAQERPQYRPK